MYVVFLISKNYNFHFLSSTFLLANDHDIFKNPNNTSFQPQLLNVILSLLNFHILLFLFVDSFINFHISPHFSYHFVCQEILSLFGLCYYLPN